MQSLHSSFPFLFHIWALQERIKFLENAQGTSVQALISRITHYGSRRLEDFDKYEAVRLAEELVPVATTTGHAKAASYDIIATTVREKIHVSKEQFKAYFLAILADKEFTKIFDVISKVDKSFQRPAPYFRTQARANQRFSSSHPGVTCYRCGTPGHKSTQCWKRSPTARYFPSCGSDQNQPRLATQWQDPPYV